MKKFKFITTLFIVIFGFLAFENHQISGVSVGPISPKVIALEDSVNPQVPELRIDDDKLATWAKFENELRVIKSSDEIIARVKSIDGFISSKNLISKLNAQKAKKDEQILAINLLRERSMLMKRKIELELERIEKEYL